LFLGNFFIIGYCEKVWVGWQYFLTIFHNISTILIHCFGKTFPLFNYCDYCCKILLSF
jgi:hypothetical protein